MIDSYTVLGLIAARGGSKGIPGKNIKLLAGKPMIAYTIDAGLKSKYLDSVVVTTDDEEIRRTAVQCGADAPFLRPAELATDEAKTIDAIIHARDVLASMGRVYDILVLLQPTSPLRTAEDIDGALEFFVKNSCRSLASVSTVSENPVLVRTRNQDGTIRPIMSTGSTIRRQDMPNYYRINGSIYINLSRELSSDSSLNDNEMGYVTPNSRSIDVDVMADFQLAENEINRLRDS